MFAKLLGRKSGSKETNASAGNAPPQVRRQSVGGGTYVDENEERQTGGDCEYGSQRPVAIPEGNEQEQAPVKPASGSSVSEIQPVSEFQPVSDIEPVTAEGTQTTSAGSDRHSAIRHAAAEVRGRPSATVPETRHTERTLSGRVIDRVSPIQQSSTGQAPVNERVQNVPGWTPTSDISTSQGTSDPNLRSGSGVPSEDEVAQLYSNGRTSIDATRPAGTTSQHRGEGEGALPEDLNIGFSGKGSGIYAPFSAQKPARSNYLGQPGEMEGEASSRNQAPSASGAPAVQPQMLQIDQSEELAPRHTEGGQPLMPMAESAQQGSDFGVSASQVAPEGSSPPSYQHAPVSRESAGSPHAQQQQQSTASVERAVSPASPTEQHSYSEAPTSDPHVSAQALPPTASITPPPPHTSPQGQDSTNAMSLHMLHSQPEVDTNYDIPPAFETAQHGQQALATPVISTFATSDLSAPHQPLSYPLHDEAGPTSTHGMATAQQSFGQRRATPQPPSPPVPCPSSRYTSHSTFGQPQQQPIFIQVDPLGQIDAQQGSAPVESVGQGQSVSASTLSAGEKKLGEGFSEGSSYPNTPDRLHRAPPAASPDYTTPQGSTQSSATPSDVDVSRETQYNPPVHTEPVLEQEAPAQGAHSGQSPSRGLPEYPRENPLFAEDDEDEQQAPVQENAPEPVFHDNPLSGSDAPRERPQTYSSPMKPMLPSSATGHSQAGYGDNDNELVPSTGASAGQTYTPPARESVTAANADVDQEVFANKAVEPESDALSTAAQADSGQEFTPQQTPQTGLSDQPIAPEGRGTYIEEEVAREVPGQVTSTPQLGREVVSHHLAEDESNIPAQDNTAVSQHVDVSEPVLVEEPVVADIAREVPIESAPQQTEFAHEAAYQPEIEVSQPSDESYSAIPPANPISHPRAQIVSRDADLSAMPPSAAWGSSSAYVATTGTTSTGTTSAFGQTRTETEAVQEPADETAVLASTTAVVETAAQPELPVSTGGTVGTHVLTSQPQLGPPTASNQVVTQEIVAQEIVADTDAVEPEVQSATVPMTREEIVAYRPGQDPEYDPTAAQAAPAPPKRVPMTAAQIASYRPGEDPAYDPVERRGWWDVNIAQGGGTILPEQSRGPSTRGRAGSRASRGQHAAIQGDHIDPRGNPANATHFGAILSGGQGNGSASTGAGYKETPLTPAPTPVAGQQPVEDMLPGNEQIDNPLYEDQGVQVDDTQVDDSGYEQGTTFHSSPVFEHDSPAQGAYSPYIHSPELVERVHSDSSLSFTAPDADHHESIYATPSFEESGETQHQAFRNNPAFLDEPKSVSVPTDTGGDRYPMVRYNLPMPSQITTAVVTEQDVEPEHPVEVESHPMFSSTSAFATSSHEPAVLPVLETAQPELTPEPILSSTSTFTAPAEEQHTFEVLETAQQGSGVMSAEPSFTRDIVDAAPAGVADEPQVNSFSSQPIFGSEPQQAVVQYLPDIQREPSFALAPSADSFEPPAFTSHPVFDAEPQSGVSASNRLSFDGLLQQDYPTALHTVATAPSIDEQGPAFHSTPLLPHSEPQFGLAEANVALPSSPAFSDRPLLNAQQPLQMPTDIIEPFSPATSVHSAVFSDRPLLGTQQHQQVITDTLVSPAASAQSVFSNRPLLGGSQHAPVHAPEPAPSAAPFASSFSDRPLLSEAQTEQVLFYAPEPTPSEAVPSSLSSRPLLTQAQPEQVLPHTPEPFSPAASLQSVFSDRPILGGVQSQQVTTYANQAYDWSAQPASPAASLQSTGFSNRPLLAGTQQQVPYTTPAAPTIPAISSQSTAFSDRPVLGEAQPSFATAAVQHDSFPEHDVTFHTQPLLDKAQLQPASALASPSPVPTTAYTASLDTAQQTQPAIFSATPLLSATPPLSGTPPFSATPLLGSPAQPAFTSPMLTDDPTLGDEFGSYNFGFHPVAPKTTTNIMLEEPSILSQPFAPTQNAVIASSDNPFAERVPLPQQPMDDPLYDPTSRTHTPPVISPHHQKQLHKTAAPLKPLDDPLYDPAAGTRPVPLPDVAAKPALVHEPEPRPAYVPRPMLAPEPVSYGHINIAHWPVPLLHLINDPVYGPAVEAAILEAGRTNVAVQVGTPRVSAQSSAAAAQPQHVTAGRFSEAAYSANRRAPGTVNLQNIGRPAQPLAPQVEEVSYQPKPEYEMGGADVLPQDPHYVKPTGYSELGAAARSALSGAGWKPDWAFEVELAKREAAVLKYPVAGKENERVTGFGPGSKTAGDEPDYLALARGASSAEPEPSSSQATANLPPSITGATAGLGPQAAAPQPSYMQLAAPPVYPNAPVTDRGFTGLGGASGGQRRRLAGRLFDRQHSLQDPMVDPVSQRYGRDEGYGVDPLPAPSRPTGLPTASRQISRAPSVQAPMHSRQPSGAPSAGYQAPYEEEEVPQEEVRAQAGSGVEERLLLEVRRRLQQARGQLNSAPPSEGDHTPLDSPMGGRPTVLQGRESTGAPGQYWRTLEEVEAEGSRPPQGRPTAGPWVQTVIAQPGAYQAPAVKSRGATSMGRSANAFGSYAYGSGRVPNNGLEGYGAGRVRNISGGYQRKRPTSFGNYSWGEGRLL